MSGDQFEKIETLINEVKEADPSNKEELEEFRLRFLGSSNEIKPLFAHIRNIPKDQRKTFGQKVNALKELAESKYEELKSELERAEREAQFEQLDLTAPGEPMAVGSRHPVSLVMNRIIDIFQRIGFTVEEGPEIEDEWHNFTAMNTPEDHPARDMQDTYYLRDNPEYLLRTHTSPVQARVMKQQEPPIRIIAPGRVYRNETISARSHCQFHQVEGLYVDEQVSFADMKQALLYFARELFGKDTEVRLRPSYFPFTEPSAEMDVYWGLEDETDARMTKGTGWLEVLGCGMVDPNVLESCDLDPDRYTGYAFGIGIERLALFLYRVTDIRYLFQNDVRFLRQFHSAW